MMLAMLAVELALQVADLTGSWNLTGEFGGGNVFRLACGLKQQGDRLEGTCKSRTGEIRLAGAVNYPKVRFSYAVDLQGSTYTLYYSGTQESEVLIAGEMEGNGARGSFIARRVVPLAGVRRKQQERAARIVVRYRDRQRALPFFVFP